MLSRAEPSEEMDVGFAWIQAAANIRSDEDE
jgi:hypothetical protein